MNRALMFKRLNRFFNWAMLMLFLSVIIDLVVMFSMNHFDAYSGMYTNLLLMPLLFGFVGIYQYEEDSIVVENNENNLRLIHEMLNNQKANLCDSKPGVEIYKIPFYRQLQTCFVEIHMNDEMKIIAYKSFVIQFKQETRLMKKRMNL